MPAIDASKSSGAAAFNVLASPLLFANQRLIIDRVAALRLPAIYQWPETAEQGAVYGLDLPRLQGWDDLSLRCLCCVRPGSRARHWSFDNKAVELVLQGGRNDGLRGQTIHRLIPRMLSDHSILDRPH
jgi:hypothetical protein